MKIVLATQYLENYGAHAWDGEGQCPQHWKCKGGETYAIENLTQDEANAFIKNQMDALYALIEYSHDYAREYVIHCEIVEDEEVIAEEWESVNIISVKDDVFFVSKVSKNDDYGYMDPLISEKRESYQLVAKGQRDNYKFEYLLKNGCIVEGEKISQYLS